MRLLLVEDDVMVASGIKLGLTDAGYAVDWVGSGERAEEVLRSESFDAAIIDIGLPGMDGLELTRRLRRAEELVDVVLTVAYVDQPGRIAEECCGLTHVLQPADALLSLDGHAGRVDPALECVRALELGPGPELDRRQP